MQKSSTIRIFSVILPTDKFQYTTIAFNNHCGHNKQGHLRQVGMGNIKPGFPINSLDIMKRTTGTCFLTGALLSLATDALAQGNDSIPRKWVDGNFYTEANYGYNFFGDKRNTYDFPHAVVDLNIQPELLGNRGHAVEA